MNATLSPPLLAFAKTAGVVVLALSMLFSVWAIERPAMAYLSSPVTSLANTNA